MKIAICSTEKRKKQKINWHRAGNSIQYYSNGLFDQFNNAFYTLSFEYTFEYANDDVYFAYSYPYTYTDLRNELTNYEQIGNIKRIGISLMNNEIIMLQTKLKDKQRDNSNFSKILVRNKRNLNDKYIQKMTLDIERNSFKKPIIVIMSRAHPSETISSFVMQGIMSYVFENSPQVKFLLSKCVIKMIPMINPDGVIHGNTRTSFSGNDLNRKWNNPDPKLHPQICAIKKTLKNQEIFAFIDLHGHSKKQSSFLYGCCDNLNFHNHHQIRLFNSIMARLEDNFNRQYSSFYISQDKRGTARVVNCKQFTPFSYTLQCSFLGNRSALHHFTPLDYQNIGKNLIKSLSYFWQCLYPSLTPLLKDSLKIQISHDWEDIKNASTITKIQTRDEKQSDGSSSNPSLNNYSQQFLNENIFREHLKNNRKQQQKDRYSSIKIVKSSRQYATGSLQKSKKKSSASIAERKVQKYLLDDKKDLLMATQDTSNSIRPTYQLYNFKSRRIVGKRKLYQMTLFDQTSV